MRRSAAMTAEQQPILDQFYTSPAGVVLPMLVRPAGSEMGPDSIVETTTAPFKAPEWWHDERARRAFDEQVAKNQAEIGQTLQVVESGGDYFEVGIINAKNARNGVLFHASTFNSAFTTNILNQKEAAIRAAQYGDKCLVYLASPGNGGSSRVKNGHETVPYDGWRKQVGQRTYMELTGSIIWEEDGALQPIPFAKNMAGALAALGLNVTELIGTDSAGGTYATGMAFALPENTVTHAFFSERSGLVNLWPQRIIGGILLREGLVNSKVNRKLMVKPNFDPYSVVFGDQKTEARAIFEANRDAELAAELGAHMIGKGDFVAAKWSSMQALRRGPTRGHDPLAKDTSALLAKHPDLSVTLGMGLRDPLYRNPERAERAARDFLASVVVQRAGVNVVMLPGMSHAYHSYHEELQFQVQEQAFGRL